MEFYLYLTLLFFLTALLYSSVGFGGGSTYLALLILFQLPFSVLPKIALICNLLVVSGGLYHYVKTKNLKLHLVLPFVVTSIPLAYLGGRLPIEKEPFFILLGVSLLIAAIQMLFFKTLALKNHQISLQASWGLGLPMGGLLGFLSGVVGIGGGIFLSPLLYFLGWGHPKQIAASSSFFIFVNSLSGLLGQWSKPSDGIHWHYFFPLIIAVFLGGQIGSRLSVKKLSFLQLQRVSAVVILFATLRIFWRFF